MLNVAMLSDAFYYYYAECHYAECRGALFKARFCNTFFKVAKRNKIKFSIVFISEMTREFENACQVLYNEPGTTYSTNKHSRFIAADIIFQR